MMRSSLPVPEGYEEVPAGEVAQFAQYFCDRCNKGFVAAHFRVQRFATGRTITCCGSPAWWVRNLREKQILCDVGDHVCDHQKSDLGHALLCSSQAHKGNCPFRKTVMDANRKFVKVEQLVCARCGLPYGVKTPEGFTQFYPPTKGYCQCKESRGK